MVSYLIIVAIASQFIPSNTEYKPEQVTQPQKVRYVDLEGKVHFVTRGELKPVIVGGKEYLVLPDDLIRLQMFNAVLNAANNQPQQQPPPPQQKSYTSSNYYNVDLPDYSSIVSNFQKQTQRIVEDAYNYQPNYQVPDFSSANDPLRNYQGISQQYCYSSWTEYFKAKGWEGSQLTGSWQMYGDPPCE